MVGLTPPGSAADEGDDTSPQMTTAEHNNSATISYRLMLRVAMARQNFATAPASIGSAAPVMYCDSSEARNNTALLTARASIAGLGSMWK